MLCTIDSVSDEELEETCKEELEMYLSMQDEESLRMVYLVKDWSFFFSTESKIHWGSRMRALQFYLIQNQSL